VIGPFDGRYSFLSNFYRSPVTLDGLEYPSVEHAYQAAKTTDPEERATVREALTPGLAKRLGRQVHLRPDWEDVKLAVMADLLRQKFDRPPLAKALLETGDEELVEVNYWRDTYWGVFHGTGENHLGRLLMERREQLR
jgi:ribA/ribD-fused uncharacterized protein